MKNVMDYGKARGMALVGKYLPEFNPFRHMDVIATMDEWGQVSSKYDETAIHRIDYPIGHAQVRRNAVQGTTGLVESIPELITAVREQGNSGVVLIAQTAFPTPRRYLDLGGFNLLFHVNSHVMIELVGKGFDGHELTQGLACHERYCLSWYDIPFVTSRSDLVHSSTERMWATVEQYQSSRHGRIKFLTEACHYSLDEVEVNIPETLSLLGDEALCILLEDVVFTLYSHQTLLECDGLRVFGVQGNVVEHNGQIKVQPWEIFRPERWS